MKSARVSEPFPSNEGRYRRKKERPRENYARTGFQFQNLFLLMKVATYFVVKTREAETVIPFQNLFLLMKVATFKRIG
jgi:hypothetical protein